MEEPAAGLEFRGVSRRYPDGAALEGLDAAIPSGELTALLGPSGSGKTTSLRVAAGLERPDEGRVLIDGTDVTDTPPDRRSVAFVFQSGALFPHLSVEANIGFGLAVRGVPGEERRKRVVDAAAVVGCSQLLARYPNELSGGEGQRVALARAVVRDPAVFLLDEPLSSLDVQVRESMRVVIRELQSRTGSTMLYVTHDQREALLLGDTVIVLIGGALQQQGTPDDIYDRPANLFVATFVGSPTMNILPADASGIRLGVRPEHVEVTTATAGGSEATVERVERAGSEVLVEVTLADGVALTARVPLDARPSPGERVGIRFDERHLHRFDAAGLRVEDR